MSKLYCRFCAEEKPHAEIATITSQDDQRTLIEKLSLFGVSFVDFSNKMLPQTACVTCLQLINISHEFFVKVKRSQAVLSEICKVEQREFQFHHYVQVEVESETGYKFPNCKAEKEESDGEFLKDEPLSSNDNGVSLVKVEKYEEIEICGEVTETSRPTSPSPKHTPVHRKYSKKQTWSTYPWQCSICGTIVDCLKALREHCQTDHLKCFAFKCADCDDQLYGFDEFVAHVKKHRKILCNYCQYCNIKMEDRSHPNSHLTETCNLCGESFDNQDSLNSHLKLYSTGLLVDSNLEILTWADYPAVCQYCNLRVTDKDALAKHCVKKHKRCFGNQCVDCDVNVTCLKDFVEHVTRHRPHLKNICPYCNIKMPDEDLDHVEEHTASLHPCAVCGKVFQQKRRLRAHEKKVLPSPPIKPPKKRFPSKNDSTCEVCGQIMKNASTLKSHLKRHVDRKRNYTCDRCGRAYYTKNNLEAHHKTHEINRKEACKICLRSFKTVSGLKEHVRTHNLEMPFQCDHCKKFFSSKGRLSMHVRVHMDIMPYQCQYCCKRFRFKNLIKIHENQHTGARPYSCNLCSREFGNWSNCNKHMKRKHGTTLAKNVRTPHGKLALNPDTGKPEQLHMDNVVKEWSEKMLTNRGSGRACLLPDSSWLGEEQT